ncbi:uncharacterized protein LOC111009254 isoform X2 [Momordica charantia]|uniref:Uncharacterized protein LOC111009254 isoform X2 n=1 Tax=Momordica charantia TaxID=3673 RepID=A0A6J1CBT0_MOMCH|nr:uncharacterized protein LOC111009254 isoform X2 [Momordica charantia]XP_022137973.1 uncharacterized protein LOC111009254 isoform X2 [Momordica charantia]
MGFLHLPIDVALKIASSLQASDICALACCSRLCREICDLDCLWESLARERWPYINASSSSGSSSSTLAKPPISTGWRNFYIRKHIEISGKAKAAVKFIEQCSPSTPIEAGDYHRAIAGLWDLKLSFVDVQMVLFKPQLNELLNLVGLHYCKNWLQVPANQVMEALLSHKISEKHVYVKWWKLGRWFYGFRMRDEHQTRRVSLAELIAAEGEDILGVLSRGAVHEVLRVQIAAVNLLLQLPLNA